MAELDQNTHLHRRPSVEGYLVGGSVYRLLGKYFATGTASEIHYGKNIKTNDLVAAKLVLKDNPTVQLETEYHFYQLLGDTPGIPRIHHFGECSQYNVLIMDLLGPNLETVFRKCGQKFGIKTTAQIAIQLISIFEQIHSKRIIFRNVKPENFCLGRQNTENANSLYLIGFIHAAEYKNSDDEHIPQFGVKPFAGTPRYMSVRTHKGKEQSRRDDLEAVGHMLIYFAKGSLPWQGIPAVNDAEWYDKFFRVKTQTTIESLCEHLPEEFYHYMLYARTLEFTHEPNYKYLKRIFERLLIRLGFANDNVYDWNNDKLLSPELFIETPKLGHKKVSFDMHCVEISDDY